LLVSTTLFDINHAAWTAGTALLAVALLLLPNLRAIAASITGRFALAQTFFAVLFVFWHGLPDEHALVSGMRFVGVASFLLCMPLYASLFKASGIDRMLLGLIGQVRKGLQIPTLLACAVASTFGLSFGTIPLYGTPMPPRSGPATAALARGVVISMLLAPTTGSVAAVMAAFPGLTLPAILAATLPMALAAFGLACLFGHGGIEISHEENSDAELDLKPMAIVVASMVALSFAGMPLLPAIAWTGVIAHLIWPVERNGFSSGIAVIRRTWDESSLRLAPEILLFVATGWLSWALSGLDFSLSGAALFSQDARFMLPGLVLASMSVLAMAGVHPMVAFGLLRPFTDKIGMGLPPVGEYTVWLIGFILALLVAPVSVLTTISAATSGLSPWQASIRLHGFYALALGATTIAYIAFRFQ
jgi:hypothetical protein